MIRVPQTTGPWANTTYISVREGGPPPPSCEFAGLTTPPPWMPRTVANLLQIMRRLFARPRAHADATPAPTVRDDLAKDSCTPTDMHTYGQDA